MSAELPKAYDPAAVEPETNRVWTDERLFHAEPTDGGNPYSIVIPPPNVTAALHLGHALNNTLQDILTRVHRMMGDNTEWIPGTDHAGIATQTVVEKRVFAEEGKRRTEFGREEFVGKIQAWKDEYEKRITEQLKLMGCSCDYERQAFTMDEPRAKAVREAFFQLFKDGLIYRGKRLVNWDPVTQTALADDEVENEEVDGAFYYMRYPLVNADPALGTQHSALSFITVATTRPETMLGDTAVAINPKDPRAAELRGRKILLPLVNREIPIIEDDYVVLPVSMGGDEKDPKSTFATGFLKVTPAHDPNDYDIGQRHKLEIINIFSPVAGISKDHGWPAEDFVKSDPFVADSLLGVDRFEARTRLVKWFKDAGLLENVKPYRHSVGHSYRSHVPIEPWLSDQWYCKVTDDRLRGAALRAMAADQFTSPDHEGAGPTSPERERRVSGTKEPVASPTSPERERAGSGIEEPVADARGSLSRTIAFPTYFITFSCYGTWLHGTDRGAVDREHNLPGTPYLVGDENQERREYDALKHPPTSLDEQRRRIVHDTVLEVCAHRGWTPIAVHIRTNHVHIVVSASPATPEKVMNDFKSYATRRLREAGAAGPEERLWTHHGSTRYLNDFDGVETACAYVVDEQGVPMDPAPFDARSTTISTSPNTSPERERAGSGIEEPVADARGSLRFFPARYAKTFQTWHENLRDWSISRQLWWGHRIPVWTVTFDDQNELLQTLTSSGLDRPTKHGIIANAIKSIFVAFQEDAHSDSDIIAFDPAIPLSTTRQVRNSGTDEAIASTLFMCTRTPEADQLMQQFADEVERKRQGKPVLAKFDVASNYVTSVERDPDVLDTWFSSALWPMSTLGWPDASALSDHRSALNVWNPTSVLCTAREIITLWVSRMVMFNLYFLNRLPFQHVFIHAMIQDGHGQKMSKTLGNGLDPLDVIQTHGADALRFAMASMATNTQDVRMPVDVIDPYSGESFTPKWTTTSAGYTVAAPVQESPKHPGKKFVTSYGVASGAVKASAEMPVAKNTSAKFDTGRNFCNKLWNAARFAMMNLSSLPLPSSESVDESKWSIADRWIVSRFNRTVAEVNDAISQYRFDNYAKVCYDFFWRDFCDWYLECIKPAMRDPARAPQTANVLASVLDGALRLMHPLIPFITEKIWWNLNEVRPQRGIPGRLTAAGGSPRLVRAPWPAVGDFSEAAEFIFPKLQEVIGAIRNLRNDHKVEPRRVVTVSILAPGDSARSIQDAKEIIETLATCTLKEVSADLKPSPTAARAQCAGCEIFVEGMVDEAAESGRIAKRCEELKKQIAAMKVRLGNESYTAKAPAHLVQQTKDQLAAAEAEVVKLGCA